MNPTGSEISLYVDAMIVEAIIADPTIIKQADMGGSVLTLMNKIKDYFATKFPDTSTNKVDDVLQFITPGAIFTLLRYLTSPWIAAIIALAQQVFNINVVGIIKSIYDNVKSLISDGKLVSSQQIDSAVSSAVDSNHSTVDEENVVQQLLQNMKNANYDVKQQLYNVRLIKMAAISYQEGKFNKTAGWAGGMQGKLLGILKKLFSLLIKILLGSAGFVVAGDVIKKFLGIDDKEEASETSESKSEPTSNFLSSLFHKSEPAPVAVYVAKQTKFKVNPSYQNKQYNSSNEDIWAEGFLNNNAGISDMLVQFAKEVYSGLNGLENFIKSTPTFAEVVRTIEFFNRTAVGSSVVFLPRIFHTKKQIVDLFIDDVAEKAT